MIIFHQEPNILNNHHLVKTEFTNSEGIDDHDYMIFKDTDQHIVKMIHPQFFNHYGYYEDFNSMESGLWKDIKTFIEDIVANTSDTHPHISLTNSLRRPTCRVVSVLICIRESRLTTFRRSRAHQNWCRLYLH